MQFSRKIQPVIAATLVEPYARSLGEGHYEEAYRRFTSPSFQATYKLEDFLEAQAVTREARGSLMRIQSRSSFAAAGNLFDNRSYFCSVLCTGSSEPV